MYLGKTFTLKDDRHFHCGDGQEDFMSTFNLSYLNTFFSVSYIPEISTDRLKNNPNRRLK